MSPKIALRALVLLLCVHCFHVQGYRHGLSKYRRILSTKSSPICASFHGADKESQQVIGLPAQIGDHSENGDVTIEIVTRRPLTAGLSISSGMRRRHVKEISDAKLQYEYDYDEDNDYESALNEGRVYQDVQEETKVEKVLDSNVGQIVGSRNSPLISRHLQLFFIESHSL